MSESSSGVNTSSGSFPKSHSSQYSEISVTHTPLSVDQSPDSGIVTTPLPSRRFRFLSWQRLEESDVRGDQLSCPRVREGPSEDDLPFERGGRRRRRQEEEGQRWEERLQENWENCVELNLSYQGLSNLSLWSRYSQELNLSYQGLSNLSLWFLVFPGAEPVLSGPE
uniref:Uncharacterized protein n=1 Tax=Hucho hucho TaxID=62062 RepID=A0A4W5KY05_9TELE